ncbi:MAG: UDP-3-O-(3-hydroxymyristoyl)glucosamine N-acyltransferase, partial [Alphaproteobacteria bacterium]
MADSRFFENKGPISIADLAGIAGATLSEGADPGLMIDDVAALDVAGPGQISFLDNRKYVSAF